MRRTIWFAVALVLTLAPAAAAQGGKTPAPAAPAAPERAPGLYMTFQTDHGDITCKLFEKEAPVTVGRIVGLATGRIGGKRYYDGLIFHRVIPQFMIQGGDHTGTGGGSPPFPGFPFDDETVATLKFDVPGRLAMANSGIRNGRGTNGSQFFITEVPTPHLNNKHTIFGDCSGASVVRRIARVPARPSDNKPATPVFMKKVLIERVGPAPANAPEAVGPAKAPAKTPSKTPAKTPPKAPANKTP